MGGNEVSVAVESLQDLERRIRSLRQLLNGEAPTPPPIPGSETVEMFQGHSPAHAAPGPLLDELQTPDAVVHLEIVPRHAAEHSPAHAQLSADADEVTSIERDEIVRLQA